MTPKEMMEKANAIHTLNVAGAQNVSASGDPNDAIRVMMYFPDWATDQEYVAGHTVMWNGAPVVCVEGHSTVLHPDWTPGTYSAGWKPWHATDPAYALPYLMLHSTYKYMAGEYCVWGEGETLAQVWRCVMDNTTWSPDEHPASWEAWPPAEAVEPGEGDGDAIELEPIEDAPPKWADLPDGYLFAVGTYFTDYGKTYLVLREFAKQAGWRPPALADDFYKVVTV